MKKIRIKCENGSGSTAYIYRSNGGWRCNLANGTAASFEYAGIPADKYMEFLFALEDAGELEALALDAARKFGNYKYSLL
jgi:hypothetical protein